MSDETPEMDPTPTPEAESRENESSQASEGNSGESDTFPRTYVEELRAEAAENRRRAKEAAEQVDTLRTALQEALCREASAGVLHEPIAWHEDYADEETGLPDVEKVKAAVEALAQDKPWLSRPRGDVGQGFRGEESDAVDLAGMLRQGA
jgi:hypothetical protein